MLGGSQPPMNPPVGDPARPNRRLRWTGAAALAGAVVLTLVLLARRHAPPAGQSTASSATSPANVSASLPDFEVDAVSVLEGDANWYDVPDQSLPQRRAWTGEFTAASNRIPPDAYVRVRRIDARGDPEKSIVVRITDNGVHRKSTIIDLDREAAEALGMVRAGQARVRVEVLALRNASTDKPVEKRDAPTAARASDLTARPAASEKQEKDAASAMSGQSP